MRNGMKCKIEFGKIANLNRWLVGHFDIQNPKNKELQVLVSVVEKSLFTVYIIIPSIVPGLNA